MLLLKAIASALACSTLAAAQLRPQDAEITWWAKPSCAAGGGGSTIVVLEQDVCQRVPGADASYVVRCAGAGAGEISFCDTSDCSSCGVTRAIGGKESCLANDAALFGSAAMSIK